MSRGLGAMVTDLTVRRFPGNGGTLRMVRPCTAMVTPFTRRLSMVTGWPRMRESSRPARAAPEGVDSKDGREEQEGCGHQENCQKEPADDAAAPATGRLGGIGRGRNHVVRYTGADR